MYEEPTQTLLLDNKTDLDVAIEEAIKESVKSSPVYEWLLDPMNTKPEMLDLMASEWGVLDWFEEDTEQMRRETVRDAPFIIRAGGRRDGIKTALDALGLDVKVKKGDKPYSLVIQGYLTSQAYDSYTSNRINERLRNYQSERDDISLILGRRFFSEIYRAALSSLTHETEVFGAEMPPPNISQFKAQFVEVLTGKVNTVLAGMMPPPEITEEHNVFMNMVSGKNIELPAAEHEFTTHFQSNWYHNQFYSTEKTLAIIATMLVPPDIRQTLFISSVQCVGKNVRILAGASSMTTEFKMEAQPSLIASTIKKVVVTANKK